MGLADTLNVEGQENITEYQAKLEDGQTSSAKRSFCKKCGSHLWLFDPRWPVHLHPHASAFDTPLPRSPAFTDYFLASKAPWVVLHEGDNIERLDGPYEIGMEEWHKKNGLWVD